MLLYSKAFGMRIEIVIGILLFLIITLAIMLFLTFRKMLDINRKYYTIMSGKKGKDLEEIVFTRFKEMDKVKAIFSNITTFNYQALIVGGVCLGIQ